MARLFEYQGKLLLKGCGIPVPQSRLAGSGEEAKEAAAELGGPVVIKAQAWVTGRAEAGGIKFADTPEDAGPLAASILGLKLKGFRVEEVLVEEKLDVAGQFYAGITVSDQYRSPVIVFSTVGGTGIEEVAETYPDRVWRQPVDVLTGLREHEARNLVRKAGIRGKLQGKLVQVLVKLYGLARKIEARALEVNPLVQTGKGEVFAADCHVTVDDNAVFRHPELNIEIAREFDRPATPLEKIAYKVEEKDYRGTFYFLQMETQPDQENGLIAFHGGGGGGSMMAMDALMREGFKLANFCDTSGNPSASKVYRAAKIILSQPNVAGYFHSGSGVASQEQYHTARGMVKAFLEAGLDIPAVIRIGGNSEEEAIKILTEYTRDLPGKVEAYGRDVPVEFCVRRLKELIAESKGRKAVS
ncbi:MAG: ATP-grasp domain-containing protein [Eubacteriales bacterium]